MRTFRDPFPIIRYIECLFTWKSEVQYCFKWNIEKGIWTITPEEKCPSVRVRVRVRVRGQFSSRVVVLETSKKRNMNRLKPHRVFPRSAIFKFHQEDSKFNDTRMGWSSQISDLKNFLKKFWTSKIEVLRK